MTGVLKQICAIISTADSRKEKARELAAAIQAAGPYRWVGVYDVGIEFVTILAYSGRSGPANPQFPVSKGLTGSAIREKKTIVVGDVRSDPRYLTAFGDTLSEIIIPVLDENTGNVVGTIDVESERAGAFSCEDQAVLEACARVAHALWQLKRS